MEKKEVFDIGNEVCAGSLDGSLGGSGSDMFVWNGNLIFIHQVNWRQNKMCLPAGDLRKRS